ncbi:2-oxoacid:acceptor oxidoreductase family protein [Lentisphaerota bacterium WC36G]|nr:2-oxoacid:acceptor oxidoreductase family protein [Lentisphaerae bacterium WC36]
MEKLKFGKSSGFFDTFERRPGAIKKNMHYCPGCGHGILHKLLAEALEEMDIQDQTVLIAPVGCSVFTYYYFDCGGISVPHGRAPAVGSGIARANPDSFVISYQGDGDLGAIGFNNFIQAANRGENMTVLFVNNAIYGMTGGQMAPTTLPGQKTMTSPQGRDPLTEGYPLKVCETVAALDSPVYVERCALTSYKNIMQAKKALRKGLENLKNRKGFSLIEFLSGCPINLKMTTDEADHFIEERMMKYFPIGKFKDIADDRPAISKHLGIFEPAAVKRILYPNRQSSSKSKDFRNKSEIFTKERRIKCAGFGGQGILSLGMMIANMARLRNFNVTWLPSYGPEMRGGTANCSVVLSRDDVGSPIVDKDTNLLIAMNQPSMDKFLPELKKNGVLLYDSSSIEVPNCSEDKKVFGINAAEIAEDLGDHRVANSVILGALSFILRDYFLEGDDKADFDKTFEEAIIDCFANKKGIVDLNLKAFYKGKAAVETCF